MKILLLLIALVLVGCGDMTDGTLTKPTEHKVNWHYDLFVDSLHGHSYIIYDGYRSGNIIHAEHCKCKEGGR